MFVSVIKSLQDQEMFISTTKILRSQMQPQPFCYGSYNLSFFPANSFFFSVILLFL